MENKERLTIPSQGEGYTLRDVCDTVVCNGNESAEVEYSCHHICKCEYNESDPSCKNCPIKKAFNRLAEYENTGLSPEEIVKLNNKNINNANNKHVVKVKVRKLK